MIEIDEDDERTTMLQFMVDAFQCLGLIALALGQWKYNRKGHTK